MVSRSAQNRHLEARCTTARGVRLKIACDERPLLSEARTLSDSELLSKLAACGITIDLPRLDKLARHFPSAESLTHWIIKEDKANCAAIPNGDDWIWLSLVCLRERWSPHRPSFEQLEDLIDLGYDLLSVDDVENACREWTRAWQCVQLLLKGFRFDSLDDLNDCFNGDHHIATWCTDFVIATKELADQSLSWAATRLIVCEHALPLIESVYRADELVPIFRLATAEAHFRVGNGKTAEQWFNDCVRLSPTFCSAWASWAEHYLSQGLLHQPGRAEIIARRGLPHANHSTQQRLWDVIAKVCAGAERPAEAEAAQKAKFALVAIENTAVVAAKAA